MKAILIYNSQTGFTKRYAEWISEASGCECYDFKHGSKKNLSDYDTIIFGGWYMAGSVTKIAWLKKQLSSLISNGKKVIVYAVGASPADGPDVKTAMERNFSGSEWSGVKSFYCPGGLNYEKMNGPSKLGMKMFVKMLSSKKDASKTEKQMAEMISHSYDISDKKYIEPILAEIQA